eukprot:972865-Pelagomonas_calceolata.AAC.5
MQTKAHAPQLAHTQVVETVGRTLNAINKVLRGQATLSSTVKFASCVYLPACSCMRPDVRAEQAHSCLKLIAGYHFACTVSMTKNVKEVQAWVGLQVQKPNYTTKRPAAPPRTLKCSCFVGVDIHAKPTCSTDGAKNMLAGKRSAAAMAAQLSAKLFIRNVCKHLCRQALNSCDVCKIAYGQAGSSCDVYIIASGQQLLVDEVPSSWEALWAEYQYQGKVPLQELVPRIKSSLPLLMTIASDGIN